ncbi:MAG: Gfo/Idh/MocA family oxidoreductase [Lachnospiraceae bacterium]|nr:Gfo/Idh/MocA family oxidoreductase [Lachnospiraceae bacterium]
MALRFGMVGGGIGSYIGDHHYLGATMDNMAELVCGSFSRDPEKNRRTAEKRLIKDPDRVYADYREMAEKESAREDGIDFVSILTPNNTHCEIAKCFVEHGIHVMCDKPLANTVEEAEELAKLVREKDVLFGMTYTYTGFPIFRQGREMIRRGMIGDILHVRAEYPEDFGISSVDDNGNMDTSAWRYNPKIVGPSLATADIGTHAEQIITQFTGLQIKRVIALFDYYPKQLPLETNSTILLDFGDGISGELWASIIAPGHECGAKIYVIGTKGSLEWSNETPDRLLYTPKAQPTQIYTSGTGRGYLEPITRELARVASGHHEGYFETFANIYRSFMETLIAKKEGRDPGAFTYPTIEDGIHGIRFVQACVKSNAAGNVWMEL